MLSTPQQFFNDFVQNQQSIGDILTETTLFNYLCTVFRYQP